MQKITDLVEFKDMLMSQKLHDFNFSAHFCYIILI